MRSLMSRIHLLTTCKRMVLIFSPDLEKLFCAAISCGDVAIAISISSGDFNAHHGMWGSFSSNHNGRAILSVIDTHDLVVLNTSVPTHYSLSEQHEWSVLDLSIVLADIASRCVATVVIEFIGSDHSIVRIAVGGADPSIKTHIPRYNFRKANWQRFRDLCDISLWSISTDLIGSYQLVETSILQAATPQTRFSERMSVPWWSAECDHTIKSKKHVFNRMKRTRSQTDIIIFKQCRARARRTILAAKGTYWWHYCSSITNNSKLAKVWRTIAKFSGKRASTHIPALTHNRITGRNDRHKAHILASHYASCNVDTHYPSAFFTKFPQLHVALQLDMQRTVPNDPRFERTILTNRIASRH